MGCPTHHPSRIDSPVIPDNLIVLPDLIGDLTKHNNVIPDLIGNLTKHNNVIPDLIGDLTK